MGDDSGEIQPINRGPWLTFWHRILKRRSAAILELDFGIFFTSFSTSIKVLTSIEDRGSRSKIKCQSWRFSSVRVRFHRLKRDIAGSSLDLRCPDLKCLVFEVFRWFGEWWLSLTRTQRSILDRWLVYVFKIVISRISLKSACRSIVYEVLDTHFATC